MVYDRCLQAKLYSHLYSMDAWMESEEGGHGKYSPSLDSGNPWQIFVSFGEKSLGKKSHQIASESPWNDEFFRLG